MATYTSKLTIPTERRLKKTEYLVTSDTSTPAASWFALFISIGGSANGEERKKEPRDLFPGTARCTPLVQQLNPAAHISQVTLCGVNGGHTRASNGTIYLERGKKYELIITAMHNMTVHLSANGDILSHSSPVLHSVSWLSVNEPNIDHSTPNQSAFIARDRQLKSNVISPMPSVPAPDLMIESTQPSIEMSVELQADYLLTLPRYTPSPTPRDSNFDQRSPLQTDSYNLVDDDNDVFGYSSPQRNHVFDDFSERSLSPISMSNDDPQTVADMRDICISPVNELSFSSSPVNMSHSFVNDITIVSTPQQPDDETKEALGYIDRRRKKAAVLCSKQSYGRVIEALHEALPVVEEVAYGTPRHFEIFFRIIHASWQLQRERKLYSQYVQHYFRRVENMIESVEDSLWRKLYTTLSSLFRYGLTGESSLREVAAHHLMDYVSLVVWQRLPSYGDETQPLLCRWIDCHKLCLNNDPSRGKVLENIFLQAQQLGLVRVCCQLQLLHYHKYDIERMPMLEREDAHNVDENDRFLVDVAQVFLKYVTHADPTAVTRDIMGLLCNSDSLINSHSAAMLLVN